MKNAPLHCWCLILAGLLLTSSAIGQIKHQKKSIFGLSALVGVNLSQIDGDNFAGFDKLGITAGLKGVIEMTESLRLNVELLYSEKGSKFESAASFAKGTKDRAIKLTYAEIPVLLVYRFTPIDGNTTYSLEGGLSMARLLDTKIQQAPIMDPLEFDFTEIKDEFESTEFNVVLGIHINPSRDWGFGFRYSGALTKFYENPDVSPNTSQREVVHFLRNFQVSALLSYNF